MSGLDDKLKGSAKEMAGKLTGDQELEAKGKTDQMVGELKDKAEDAKDNVGNKVNDLLDKAKDSLNKDDEQK
ncbi:MAG: CsbD family protein [Candidatus Saccharimonadales bacterium]